MKRIDMTVTGITPDFDLARKLAESVAEHGREESMLVAWNDQVRNIHSPQCLQCEIKGEPGWEVYGRNHGGSLRVSINNDQYVFIFS